MDKLKRFYIFVVLCVNLAFVESSASQIKDSAIDSTFCNENISHKDKATFEILELNPPLFQCKIDNSNAEWIYNETLQKDYDKTLIEIRTNFTTLSLTQAKNLRYAFYLQDTINTLLANKDKKKSAQKIISALSINQKDIANMQIMVDKYYSESLRNLNQKDIANLKLKIYGRLESIQITQKVKDNKIISKDEIKKAQDLNKQILMQIKNISQLNFNDENKESLFVDIVNNLAFIFNANLLLNKGKDYKERQFIAYDNNKSALELIENLLAFSNKLQNKENQFISLQGSLITIQNAIMSVEGDFDRLKNKEKYIEIFLNVMQNPNTQEILKKFVLFHSAIRGTDSIKQKQEKLQTIFTKITSIFEVAKLTDDETATYVKLMRDYFVNSDFYERKIQNGK